MWGIIFSPFHDTLKRNNHDNYLIFPTKLVHYIDFTNLYSRRIVYLYCGHIVLLHHIFHSIVALPCTCANNVQQTWIQDFIVLPIWQVFSCRVSALNVLCDSWCKEDRNFGGFGQHTISNEMKCKKLLLWYVLIPQIQAAKSYYWHSMERGLYCGPLLGHIYMDIDIGK